MSYPEGVPQRCFTLTINGEKRKICVIRQTWPLWYMPAWPKVPGPDPAPKPSVVIEGVKPALLRDLEILDSVELLSRHLSPGAAKSVRKAVKEGVKRVQQQLPPHVALV